MPTRRQLMIAGGALSLLGMAGPRAGLAQDAGDQGHGAGAGPMGMPASREFRVGALGVTSLLGGAAMQEDPHSIFGLNVDDATFAEVSAANFIPADRTVGSFSPALVQAGEALILFDAGFDAGGIVAALAAAGRAPGDVTHVVLTHMHPDHIGGLIDASGAPTFGAAELVAGRVEFDFWAGQANEMFEAKVRPLADGIRFLAGGDEVAPGIAAVETFGHTPGHLAFLMESEGQRLMVTGDVVNHYVWSMGHPDWEVLYDNDKAAAAAMRREVLGMLAAERVPMMGYHMPPPGLGFVEAKGEGFGWVPATYQFLPPAA